MYESFLEIAYEADVNIKEDPELYELAEELCNEYHDTRAAAITELRKMILDREECFPYRMDDEYLLRFLRARKFTVSRAHKLLVRNCTFREEHKNLYEGVNLWDLGKVNNAIEGSMFTYPDTGRIIVFRIGQWDPNEYPVEDFMRAVTAMTEMASRQPNFQVMGGTVIIDVEGLTVKQITALTPTIAYQTVCLMGLATPSRLRACHIINYSWILNTFFYLFKKFIPQEAWSYIHFHGNDVKSLQKHIDINILPPKYGGSNRCMTNCNTYLKKMKKYRDNKFDNDMKSMGYVIKE